MKRTLLKVIFLLSAVCGIWALQFEGTVISPVPGNWENTQPLIVDTPDTCEVYYSLSGTDPLISGFAYDGPILLDGTGPQKLTLVSVSDKGISDTVTINFSSNNRPTPSYIPQTSRDVYIRMSENTRISLPDSVSWAAGISADQANPGASAFLTGGEISLNGRCDMPRILPLIINTSQGFYRYLIRVGADASSLPAPVPEISGIEFSQWNYIRFNRGQTTLYSIDGSPWQQTSKPVYIDRTEEHTVSWKALKPVSRSELADGYETDSDTKTMVIPAKPSFNLPEKSWTGKAVMLSFPSDDYLLSYEDDHGHVHYQTSWGMATIQGDSTGVNGNFNIWYKGIKQGAVNVSFLINRRIPDSPVITSDAQNAFSRSDVTVTFKSANTVYYKVEIPSNSPYGFDFATDNLSGTSYDAAPVNTDDYLRLTEGRLTLAVNPDSALLYVVSAFSEDLAGNRSDIAQYSVIVDGVNLYVADESATDTQYMRTAPYGSMNNPCKSLEEAVTAAEKDKIMNPRIFVYGTHTLEKPLYIRQNMRFQGKQDARIICRENCQLNIVSGSSSFSGITIEKKQNAQPGNKSASDSTDGRKYLISVSNASLSLYDCELYTDFMTDGIVLEAENSAVNIKKCGMTSRAATYTALVSSHNSKIFMYNVRGIANAPTAVGISAESGMSFLADSAMSVIGSLGRIAEYVNVSWVLEACSLQGTNAIPVESAIWTDMASVLLSDKANTCSGFSKLWVRAEK